MSELIQVRKKAQVTLPLSVRRQLGVEEGDYMDVQVRDGEIVLKVKKLVDKEQTWFWTRRWQQGEMEAEADIRAGHVHSFADIDEAIAFLDEQGKKKAAKSNKANR